MSFLPNVKQVRREDLGANVPSWIDGLLSVLNSFMESIYTLVNGNISLTDNINCRIFNYTFTTKSDYSTGGFDAILVSVKLNSKINGVIVFAVNNLSDTSAVSLTAKSAEWDEQPNACRIKYIAGLANSTKYQVRLLII